MKKIIKIILMVIAGIILIFLIGRHSWRLFGYSMCSSSVFCTDVTVTNGVVSVYGSTADSISSYVGYKYKIENGNLYIGVKFNLLLGFIDRNGSFNIAIETKKAFNNIYFITSDGIKEPPIWSKTLPITD